MFGSAASFSASLEMLAPMIWGFSSEALVSDSSVRNLPSHPKRELSATLNMVRVLSGRLEPSRPTSWSFVGAPFVPRSWHDEQLRELSRDRRGSPNRLSPSLIFRGSIFCGAGMGRIGSSPVVPFDSNVCPSVRDGPEESCKPPNISTQITAGQRQRLAIGVIPFSSEMGNRRKNLLSGIFIELWSKQSYSTQHWPRRPTADIWGWFADCEAHVNAAARIANGRSFPTPS